MAANMQDSQYPRPAGGPAALADVYTGPLQQLSPPLHEHEAPAATVDVRRTQDRDWLAPVIERFAAASGYDDRRAAASQWSKWYFNTLIVPAVAANLLLHRDLPPDPGDVGVVIGNGAHAEQLVLPAAVYALPASPPDTRFSTLVDRYLRPMSEALSTLTGISPRVFASNAGNTLEYCVAVLADHPAAREGDLEQVRELLTWRRLPDGRSNFLYQPVRYLTGPDGSSARVRRVCCVRYLASGLGYCSNCPLAVGEAPSRDGTCG
ncbi:siderophore-iron reductase FhuF [Aquisalimonas lutea]|uniref:siderophore-iron reductase FhuF n=1 Tax=Aquisalimonas lutea TaxID=1327750 RepID=UPI0025B4A26C|nr:siderophore-iron reductase FhuF [Aquisalimonas lutea]MDN3516846.1 siderophore-iron reductase FhuF [Aquisalimonas lutea]